MTVEPLGYEFLILKRLHSSELHQRVSNQATALTQSRICIGNARARAWSAMIDIVA